MQKERIQESAAVCIFKDLMAGYAIAAITT